jgi:hypothetical protein
MDCLIKNPAELYTLKRKKIPGFPTSNLAKENTS